MNEAIEKNTELQEITRFLHYYTRFRNHENSQKMEEPLLTSVRKKMEVLASSLGINKEGWPFKSCYFSANSLMMIVTRSYREQHQVHRRRSKGAAEGQKGFVRVLCLWVLLGG